MGTPLPLPAGRAYAGQPRLDPRERLDALRTDTREAKAQIREALDQLAARHGIATRDIDDAMAHANSMLADAVANAERDIEHEIEDDDPV